MGFPQLKLSKQSNIGTSAIQNTKVQNTNFRQKMNVGGVSIFLCMLLKKY
ncbi:hypothetical protein P4283_10865 [Bacillus thuringiensis]|nr:hypothetical protein [Bacillus thuringiensis]